MIRGLVAAANDGGLHSAAVQTAIIGGIFALLGVLMSFVLDKPRRSPPAPRPTPAPADDDELEAELRERATRAEAMVNDLRREIQRYRELLVINRIDPDTGVKIRARPRGEPDAQGT